jgi:outer membrane protein assembly factor BamA
LQSVAAAGGPLQGRCKSREIFLCADLRLIARLLVLPIMPRNCFCFVSAVVVLSVCQLAPAQKFQPKTIQFKGAPEYSDQELLAAANLKRGVILTAAEMNEHSKLLMDSGVFDSVVYKFDGVDLVYQLSVAPQLYAMHLDNLPLTTGAALNARIHEQLPLYHGKVPAEGTQLNGVINVLQQALAAEGIHATVTATPTGRPGSREVTAMTFSIAAPTVRVGAIDFRGVSPAMAAKIKGVADHAAETPFSTDDTAANLEHVLGSFYADEGYAAVKVQAVRAGNLVVDATTVSVPYAVTIEEGHLYKLGSIHLPTDSLVTQPELDKWVSLQTSTTVPAAPLKGAAIRGIWAVISAKYKSKGYLDCAIVPHPEFDEAASMVNYTVEIKPGAVYHLGLLRFDNVSDELKKLLMRNWQMMPGDPFDEGYVAGFLISAQKSDPLLMRTLAGVKPTYTVMADPNTHEVNCVIKLERIH